VADRITVAYDALTSDAARWDGVADGLDQAAAGVANLDLGRGEFSFAGTDVADEYARIRTQVLQLLADGMSNADVASRLFISQETVKSHVRHILMKLEADTRTHAVAIALREAIID
jgi:DNA-binding CsgD family transcriptional regulator